jgi:methylated-DNA-[protein]-cysteine S-methyltransferase
MRLSVFLTEFGWCGLAGSAEIVSRLTIGHASAQSVRDDLGRSLSEADWFPELRRRLEQYALGEPVDFDDVQIEDRPATEFQRHVVAATRGIRYGETLSYAQLAAKAGRPGAARAVGNVMRSNRVPIIIPCHRVIASGGRLGGFSAPQGVGLKQRMLAMEASAVLA